MNITEIKCKAVEPFDFDVYWIESCRGQTEVITAQGTKVTGLTKLQLKIKNEDGQIVPGEKIVGVIDYGNEVAGSILDWHLNGRYNLDYQTSLDLYLVKKS